MKKTNTSWTFTKIHAPFISFFCKIAYAYELYTDNSCAKICIQIDLLKKLPSRLWLECGDSIPGCWQAIEYEKLPKYCKHCMRLGHDVHACMLAHPLAANPTPAPVKIYQKKDHPCSV